jgi:tetratricopeptide (TPR) repeat protein
VCALIASIIRLSRGVGRKSLEVYDRAYADEIGDAFLDDPKKRKQLLSVCRYYDEASYTKALKLATRLVKQTREPCNLVPIMLFIALSLSEMGIYSEAKEVYLRLLELDPDNAQAHSNLGLVYKDDGDIDSAISHFNRALEIDPKSYHAYVNRANCYFTLQGYENAITDAKRALAIKNNGREAASLLTIIYALLGDDDNKQFYYHIAISAGEDPGDLYSAIDHYLTENHIPTGEG